MSSDEDLFAAIAESGTRRRYRLARNEHARNAAYWLGLGILIGISWVSFRGAFAVFVEETAFSRAFLYFLLTMVAIFLGMAGSQLYLLVKLHVSERIRRKHQKSP
jgi:hypothetical protein